jgi:hypothetical protein
MTRAARRGAADVHRRTCARVAILIYPPVQLAAGAVLVRGGTGGEEARSSFLYRACQRYYARRSVKDDPARP